MRRETANDPGVVWRYPRLPADPFYQQFADPARAYSNLPAMEQFYHAHSDLTPSALAEDFIHYAFRQAHSLATPGMKSVTTP